MVGHHLKDFTKRLKEALYTSDEIWQEGWMGVPIIPSTLLKESTEENVIVLLSQKIWFDDEFS